MLNTQALYKFIQSQWQETILPSLMDYIKIPNKSPLFDAAWEAHGYMERAITHLATWCKQHGPKTMQWEVVRLPNRTPLLFLEIPGQSDDTVLLYGHLDKQPEMTGWKIGYGPWHPVLSEGKLYGRGGADDGYAAYAAVCALRALEEQGIPHARCVILIEACEESGSYDLPFYVDALAARIGHPDLVVCLDSGAGNYEQLWVTTSLRGNLVGELQVELIKEGVHSGSASGVVADSFRVVRALLSRIEDETTGKIKLPALHCDIPTERSKQAAACATILGDAFEQAFPLHDGVKPVVNDRQELILNRTWRPTLTVTGAEGLPAMINAGNVLRSKTALKLSLRIPPLVDPNAAAAALQNTLTENPPYQAKVAFKVDSTSQGWNAPVMDTWLEKTLQEASEAFYQKPVGYLGEGGTIPFMAMLGEKFPKAQFVITGVLGPQSNAHGPNEFLHIDMAQKITACVSYIVASHFRQ